MNTETENKSSETETILSETETKFEEPETELEETNDKPKKNRAKTVIEAIIIFIISLILVAMSDIGRTHNYRRISPQKVCFGNQRVLIGGIDMYNMDHSEMINTYNQSIRDLLIKEKYLPASFMKDVECEFLAEGDLTGYGFLYCVYHGEPDERKKGKDEFASLTPKKDSIRARNKNLLIIGLLFGPTLIFLLIKS
jgi:competence protein ComGC